MREIKFRGKTKGSEKSVNGLFVYGCLFKDVDGKTFILYDFPGSFGNERLKKIEVIPETVGQFTGKLTKSGIEIYEGDKLQQSKDCYWVVKWSDSDCGWNCYQYVFSKDDDEEYSWKKSDNYPLGHSLIGLLTYNYEVIDNIHQ